MCFCLEILRKTSQTYPAFTLPATLSLHVARGWSPEAQANIKLHWNQLWSCTSLELHNLKVNEHMNKQKLKYWCFHNIKWLCYFKKPLWSLWLHWLTIWEKTAKTPFRQAIMCFVVSECKQVWNEMRGWVHDHFHFLDEKSLSNAVALKIL